MVIIENHLTCFLCFRESRDMLLKDTNTYRLLNFVFTSIERSWHYNDVVQTWNRFLCAILQNLYKALVFVLYNCWYSFLYISPKEANNNTYMISSLFCCMSHGSRPQYNVSLLEQFQILGGSLCRVLCCIVLNSRSFD